MKDKIKFLDRLHQDDASCLIVLTWFILLAMLVITWIILMKHLLFAN